MANVEHSALTGSNLHEPKGVAAASANTIYIADGVGSGSWTTVGASSLAAATKVFQGQLLHVREEQSAGVTGGTFTSGAYRTRTLNTVKTNEISGASLAANQITLPAGTYFIEATAPAFQVDNHNAVLFNRTDNGTVVVGTAERSDASASYAVSRCHINGRFTLTGTKAMEILHICGTTKTSTGFGLNTSFNTEVYTEVMIWKVA